MARFQETHDREDTTVRRPITADDLAFLHNLQTVLNTQDTMGNADPRFWVIAQTEERPCGRNDGEKTVLMDNEGHIYETLDAVAEYVNNLGMDHEAKIMSGRLNIYDEYGNSEYAYGSVAELAEYGLDEEPFEGLHITYLRSEKVIQKDTLFLTHAACEEHLRKYGYNYGDDAHAYAMTAIRSPEFEKLITILQTVDFDILAWKLGINLPKPEPKDPAPDKPWRYETGIETPEVMGSGSTKSNVQQTMSLDAAIKLYKTGNLNYLLRWKVVGDSIIRERYNDDTGKFERS